MNLRESILNGKHVTGHCLEYDYKDGTAFVKARDPFWTLIWGRRLIRWNLYCAMRRGRTVNITDNFGHPTSVIVDYPFITGRSTPDSTLTGEKIIDVLDGDPPLRRWGWQGSFSIDPACINRRGEFDSRPCYLHQLDRMFHANFAMAKSRCRGCWKFRLLPFAHAFSGWPVPALVLPSRSKG